MRFGRKRPIAVGPRLRLSNYLTKMPETPPASCDYTPKARPSLSNIFGNDSLGDCVIAAGYHIVGLATGNADGLFVPTMAQVLGDYSAIGGYVAGEASTDQGCDPNVAAAYWAANGFANGTRLTGWLALDPTNILEIKIAMHLFENLFPGFECPDKWIGPFPSGDGFEWDVAGDPDPANGHQVCAGGYGPAGATIDTWGMLGTLTWPAIAEYCAFSAGGDLAVFLTPDIVNKAIGKSPNGIDWATLIDDFDAIGGHVEPIVVPPAPTPSPSPPNPGPSPTPGPVLSLSDAQAALAIGWPTS